MSPERIVDVVLVVLAVEVAALAVLRGRMRALPPWSALLPNLAAGFFLVVAVRCAVAGYGTPVLAPLLLLAGIAHLADLIARTRR